MNNQTQPTQPTTNLGTEDSLEKKVRARQIKTSTLATSQTPMATINEGEFALWFNKLQSTRGKDDTIEAPPGVVAKLENDYPGCFTPGYFMFHGLRVIPEGTREVVEAALSLTQEEKMHGSK